MAAHQLTLVLDLGAASNTTDTMYVVGSLTAGSPGDDGHDLLVLRPPGAGIRLAMTSLGDGVWQLALNDLADGATYAYQFRVGSHVSWNNPQSSWEVVQLV